MFSQVRVWYNLYFYMSRTIQNIPIQLNSRYYLKKKKKKNSIVDIQTIIDEWRNI